MADRSSKARRIAATIFYRFREDFRSLASWLAFTPLILAIIFGCSMIGQIGIALPGDLDSRSRLFANYGVWPFISIPPISTAIMEDIRQAVTGLPTQIVAPGIFGEDPTTEPHYPARRDTELAYQPTNTPEPVEPATQAPRATRTQRPTRTPRPPTSTPTSRPSATPSPTPSPTNTLIPIEPTNPPPRRPTNTPVPTQAPTDTPLPTDTSLPPTEAPTGTPRPTRTPTQFPTSVISPVVSYTPTQTPIDTQVPSNTPRPTNASVPTQPSPPAPSNTPTLTPTPKHVPKPTKTPRPTKTPKHTKKPHDDPQGTPVPPVLENSQGILQEKGVSKACGAIYQVDLGIPGWIDELIVCGTNAKNPLGALFLDPVAFIRSWSVSFYWDGSFALANAPSTSSP